ncbi:serine/threonine-protein phosphatase [Glaciihabitans arcticus]|uniref:Serine/threonine-protein phosphatase n=1 Tax=Glaciihabitans arcticus TaxID=2668039 RepID=A0A4Q9GTV6_9MICO|nr:PP2C family serine/threonine-protein phosphatase [Glaciihabitans arcticus]TBN58161.1 serine/threonine-protein phosphatase [Glaciihabitans arcticus]
MATSGKSAAVSHVGKIRANNQDSGYAGSHLFVVADGMGGHAGGDVASAITVNRVIDIDKQFSSGSEAEFAFHASLTAANAMLAETVFDHPELTGMGTTVSGMLLVDGQAAIAHIGDSRIYLLRDGELKQVTSDHTFVQRLVDSGRITEEEAAVHPRRSVLMRVLGDVDATPEIDTSVVPVRDGDRWLLCSDGLSSYVSEDKIAAALMTNPLAQDAAERLVKDSLDQGAPDNVTVVIVDIDSAEGSAHVPPLTVGSASVPLVFEGDTGRKAIRLPTLLLHPLKATKPDDSHFEPESDGYLDELILEDRKRARRRRITWLVVLALIVAAVVAAAVIGYQWTQTRFFVGASGTSVAIYQGVQQDLGPISLSNVYRKTDLGLDQLSDFSRKAVMATISASDLADAERIVEQLVDASN